jgi:hypothetical protein
MAAIGVLRENHIYNRGLFSSFRRFAGYLRSSLAELARAGDFQESLSLSLSLSLSRAHQQ